MPTTVVRSSCCRAAALLLTFAPFVTTPAATITVNDVGDGTGNDGKCTLREAIMAANGNTPSGGGAGECAAGQGLPTVDTIAFAISGSGVHTIGVLSPLPAITQAVVIDGYTQSGSSANTLVVGDDAVLRIQIDASAMAPPTADLLDINSDGSTLRGLVISHVAGTSVFVGAASFSNNANTIAGNFFGTDPSGTVFAGGTQYVIRVAGATNVIGGASPAARNVIVGGGTSNVGAVVISGTSNVMQGNYVGLDSSGTSALQPPGGTNGLELGPGGSATGTVIGGKNPGEGNVIFGSNIGIRVGNGVQGTIIQGNYIGIDATGTRRLGGNVGIGTNNGPTGTIIGGSQPGAGNVISGNNTGIYLGDGAAGTIIKGNRIGTDATGTRPVSNLGDGIFLITQSLGSIIGGKDPGEGNTIAFNCGQGIGMYAGFGFVGWAMLGNSTFSNAGLGISLFDNGNPIPNDVGDLDTGSNNLQNHPVIAAAPVAAGMVDLAGTLNSLPATTYRVEFFSGQGCHPTGAGEGRKFLGARDLPTDVSGNASFGNGTAMFAIPAGHSVFTATATDPDGNTSEFSQCFGTPVLLFHDDFEGSCAGYD
jgi:CSLREA domain-containing protein